jgi:hypothetical protein
VLWKTFCGLVNWDDHRDRGWIHQHAPCSIFLKLAGTSLGRGRVHDSL